MKNIKPLVLCIAFSSAILTGCAYVNDPAVKVEQGISIDEQRANQVAINTPRTATLKRKIAIGRITNETSYGKSLIRDQYNDPVGKQLVDLLSNALVQSGHFIVLERPDLGRIYVEQQLTPTTINQVGADLLIMGSLTEFGRKTDGRSGFLTTTKRQVATAKIDIRLVDVESARVVFASSGSGQAITESGSVFGWGDNKASYDGSLNDKAISTAISEVVNGIVSELEDKPWKSYFLSIQNDQLYMSGGKSQGIKIGDHFKVKNKGEKVKSPQTGFMVNLPGVEIAKIEVVSLFGHDEVDEGAICKIVSGSIAGYGINDLVIEE